MEWWVGRGRRGDAACTGRKMLPRMASIHPVSGRDELAARLAAWTPWLSTMGTDAEGVDVPGVHRVCRLGWMQAPIIPRHHDGRSMLGGLHSTDGEHPCE